MIDDSRALLSMSRGCFRFFPWPDVGPVSSSRQGGVLELSSSGLVLRSNLTEKKPEV